MTDITGNMLIAQSGGPTAVINQSLVGAILEAKQHKCIRRIYGALHGIQGILDENFVDLRKETKARLEAVAQTPASALGTVRKKPTAEDLTAIFKILDKNNIRYFFYIGGNDSAETTYIINEEAKKANYDLRCFHIPKTIDNDLRENDHTPGFGSAAKFVATALMGDDLDNRSLGGVKVDVIMGRHAGFLTAASALARTQPDDGPHLIYLPERPFSMAKFAKDIKSVYDKLGRCVVTVSEGIADSEGNLIAAAFNKEFDSHGNAQLSGSGALGDLLAHELKKRTNIKRVRVDTFGYLQRSFPGLTSTADAAEARAVGITAVKFATGKQYRNGSVAIKRKAGKRYHVTFERVALKQVARRTRCMPNAFINKAANDVTKAFIDYAAPIVGPLVKTARLKALCD